ncbi:fucose permease [Sphingomonas sp. Leaf412]|uniref:L-fucose:H+ symporter permease n=1 Tax=Sphingomonas sp. Leaf412 TaxID=1736370 RepID=UPI0006FAAA10|nr:L-fucose:H+ symporter permease [Sphingomonas sp. Leaf412]KQT34626.1 fucose permease [Sphingomonas sp. Leaf412]
MRDGRRARDTMPPAATAAVVLLYALWGMAHNLNDILVAQFRKAFDLTDLQSSLVQSCFYVAYLVAPIPVAMFMHRFGYRRGIVVGLSLYAIGALLFWPAAQSVTYGAFLGALFVIACGIVFLETAGTGAIVAIGRPETAEWRINVAQAFNPLGTIAGVLIGRQFIFSAQELDAARRDALSPAARASLRLAEAQAVQLPYLGIAIVLLIVAVAFLVIRFPPAMDRPDDASLTGEFGTLLGARFFAAGVGVQFCYVGAQVGVWSFLIRYAQQTVPGTGERTAALYLTVSLAIFFAGRLASLPLLRRWSSAQVCRTFACLATAGGMAIVAVPGPVGVAAMIAVSFFMSVMFPSIYAIALHGHAARAKPAAALMTMAIVGGAVLTAAMGAISDASGRIELAYLVPVAGFAVVAAYAHAAVRAGRVGSSVAAGH